MAIWYPYDHEDTHVCEVELSNETGIQKQHFALRKREAGSFVIKRVKFQPLPKHRMLDPERDEAMKLLFATKAVTCMATVWQGQLTLYARPGEGVWPECLDIDTHFG